MSFFRDTCTCTLDLDHIGSTFEQFEIVAVAVK